MTPTETNNQENKSSNNYGPITTFFAGSLTSTALIAGTCYIKPELCISLLNTASKESTALVILPSNTELTVAWEGLKGSMIKFAQEQLTPTQEQLIVSALSGATSSIFDMINGNAWALKVDEIDEIIIGSDGHNSGPEQTLDDLDMSRIESDSNSVSGRSTPDQNIEEQHNNLSEEESGTVSTRTRTASVDYQGDRNELNLEGTVDQSQGSPSGADSSDREYQSESGRDSLSTTPVNTPVKLDNDGLTERPSTPISDVIEEKRVSFEESQQTAVEMSGQNLPVDNVEA